MKLVYNVGIMGNKERQPRLMGILNQKNKEIKNMIVQYLPLSVYVTNWFNDETQLI